MASKTINTIQGTLNWASAFILNRPSIGVSGTYQEPALTIANLIMSTVLSPPFAWSWNRNTTTFTTVAGTSDYTVAMSDFGWLEKATRSNNALNPPIVELQIVTNLAAAGRQNPPFKIALFSDDNAGNYVFRLLSVPDAVYTITLTYQKAPILATSLYSASLGSITSIAAASGTTAVYTASGGVTGGNANGLQNTYIFVSGATNSLNNGLYYATASSSTTVTLQNPNAVLQSGAGGIITSATSWAPIPDKYNFLYERGMKAHLNAMYDAATYAMELQIFFRQLVGVSEGLSDAAKAIFLNDRLEQVTTEAANAAATGATPRKAQ